MPEPKRLRCPVCDKRFTPSRSDAVTCSPACRQKAYRRRQNPPTRAAPKRPTKTEQIKKTSSSKDTRGGAGRKQGRKKVLTFEQMLDLGMACENLWHRLTERKGWADYRNQPHVKGIRQEQARTDLIPLRARARRDSRDPIRDISENIDDILDHARRAAGHATPKFTRAVNIPLKRPYGKRELVKRVVIRWYRCTHGIVVSPRRIQACWAEYRSFFQSG
jgi:hypothetical protein